MQEGNNFSLLRQPMVHRSVQGRISRARASLLEGDKAGRVGGTDTGPAVLHRLVGDGKLCETECKQATTKA